MLQILNATLEAQNTLMVLPGKSYYPVRLQATISDTDPGISWLAGSFDWNDGTPPVTFGPTQDSISVDETRHLAVGTYFLTLRANNYRQPTPDQTAAYYSVTIQPEQRVPDREVFLFGPILPRDNGYPNAAQWNFDIANDVQVLASSVKMLLITAKGERLNLPTYGTRLRRMVFEPKTSAINSLAQQEITEALSLWEPRVSLDSFALENVGPREILVTASFTSKINQSTFSLALPFSQ